MPVCAWRRLADRGRERAGALLAAGPFSDSSANHGAGACAAADQIGAGDHPQDRRRSLLLVAGASLSGAADQHGRVIPGEGSLGASRGRACAVAIRRRARDLSCREVASRIGLVSGTTHVANRAIYSLNYDVVTSFEPARLA